ncbi:Aste57867_19822 [Aphanomyces stellatus]|uniref:Aste57867_19822 protein n=1 Tax=Aphanomyces stellatus TaxID=120398 RepID=A0A485LDI3_9STRA|nr:hypothetical protein As57867_019757 [Aphanomyces stellatus]VFT96520.1 Aste57867_19822 [Aphanomyces stellatus]
MCIIAQHAVVVVDPVSTGLHIAREVIQRGYRLIILHSSDIEKPACIANMPADVADHAVAEIHHSGLESTMVALQPFSIVGVLAGCETGVTLADHVSDRLGLATNGAAGAVARRNKYVMGEQIRAAGLRAVKQCNATTFAQAEAFITNELKPSPFEVIVKPVDSAGSDDVFLCKSMDDVHRAFDHIQGHLNQLGLMNMAALVQEYLVGTEYVVDTVSRHGEHKVVAMWEYDKGLANGAPFVYYAVRLVDATSPKHIAMMEYVLKVLDALHIVHGPSHAEVKWVRGEPCLVEVGARCHGNGGYFIRTVDKCIGYNQVTATVDAYFDPAAFAALPAFPRALRAHGCEVNLISHDAGVIETVPGMDSVGKLASYNFSTQKYGAGDVITPTVDVFTMAGSIWLLHENKDTLEQDIKRIRALERRGFWTLKPAAMA